MADHCETTACQTCAGCRAHGTTHNMAANYGSARDSQKFDAAVTSDSPDTHHPDPRYYRWDAGQYPYQYGRDNPAHVHHLPGRHMLPYPQPVYGCCGSVQMVPCSFGQYHSYAAGAPAAAGFCDRLPAAAFETGSYFVPPPSAICATAATTSGAFRTGSDLATTPGGRDGDLCGPPPKTGSSKKKMKDAVSTTPDNPDRMPPTVVATKTEKVKILDKSDAVELQLRTSEKLSDKNLPLDELPVKESANTPSPIATDHVTNTRRVVRGRTKASASSQLRRTMTPLYGMPSWWGDELQETIATGTASVATESRHQQQHDRRARATAGSTCDVLATAAGENQSAGRSDVTTTATPGGNRRTLPPNLPLRHSTGRQSRDVTTPAEVAAAQPRPPVAFTVSLQGGPVDLSDCISRYLPAKRLRHLDDRRSGAKENPNVTDSGNRTSAPGLGLGVGGSRCHDDVADDVSEAGTYTIDVDDDSEIDKDDDAVAAAANDDEDEDDDESFTYSKAGSRTSTAKEIVNQHVQKHASKNSAEHDSPASPHSARNTKDTSDSAISPNYDTSSPNEADKQNELGEEELTDLTPTYGTPVSDDDVMLVDVEKHWKGNDVYSCSGENGNTPTGGGDVTVGSPVCTTETTKVDNVSVVPSNVITAATGGVIQQKITGAEVEAILVEETRSKDVEPQFLPPAAGDQLLGLGKTRSRSSSAGPRVSLGKLGSVVLTIYTEDQSVLTMSKSTVLSSSRSTDKRKKVDTARSTTSIDTNVLLRKASAGELESARSIASVDTNILLGELDTPRNDAEPGKNKRHTRSRSPSPPRRHSPGPAISSSQDFKRSETVKGSREAGRASNSTYVKSSFEPRSLALTSESFSGQTTSHSVATTSTYRDDQWASVSQSAADKSWDPLSSVEKSPPRSPVRLSSNSVGVSWDPKLSASISARELESRHDNRLPDNRSSKHRYDASVDTTKSVSSIDCAPSVYDTDRRGSPEASNFDDHVRTDKSKDLQLRKSVDSKFMDGDNSAGSEASLETERSEASLDAAIHNRDSSTSGGADVSQLSVNTARTLASIDTNILLRTTEDVVLAMEAARTQQTIVNNRSSVTIQKPSAKLHSGTATSSTFDDRAPSNEERRSVAAVMAWDTDRSGFRPADIDTDMDTDRLLSTAGARIVDDNTRHGLPKQKVPTRKPPAHGKPGSKPQYGNRTDFGGGRHGNTRQVWRSSSDQDVRETVEKHLRQSGLSAAFSSHLDNVIDSVSVGATDTERSDVTETQNWTSSHARRGQYSGQRSRSASRPGSIMESDRSLVSGVSLGQKIVAKSRENMRASQPIRTGTGKHDSRHQYPTKTNGSGPASAGKKAANRSRSSSPSGLVLEGYRVPVRPASTGILRHQPASHSSGKMQRVEYTNTRNHEREIKKTVEMNRTSTGLAHNGWTSAETDNSRASFDDDVCAECENASEILDSQRTAVDENLVSIICQLSSSVKLQTAQLVNKIQSRLHIPMDSSLQGAAGPQQSAGSSSQQSLLAALDNLQLMGRQLLAVNKALSAPPTAKPARRERSHNSRH